VPAARWSTRPLDYSGGCCGGRGIDRTAAAWAAQRRRPLDAELLATILELREDHDGYPRRIGRRAARRLLLITMPAYGRKLPDIDRLPASTSSGGVIVFGRGAAYAAAGNTARSGLQEATPGLRPARTSDQRHLSGIIDTENGSLHDTSEGRDRVIENSASGREAPAGANGRSGHG
jgi:hypothetical protein